MLLISPTPSIERHLLLFLLVSNWLGSLLLFLRDSLGIVLSHLVEGHCGFLDGREARVRLGRLLVLDVKYLVLVVDFAEVIAEHIYVVMRFLLVHESDMLLQLLLLAEVGLRLQVVLVHQVLALLELGLQLLLVLHVRLHHPGRQEHPLLGCQVAI